MQRSQSPPFLIGPPAFITALMVRTVGAVLLSADCCPLFAESAIRSPAQLDVLKHSVVDGCVVARERGENSGGSVYVYACIRANAGSTKENCLRSPRIDAYVFYARNCMPVKMQQLCALLRALFL